MRRIIIMVLTSLVCLTAMPNSEIDSISKLLPKSHDTVKIELYLKLSEIALDIDSQLCIHYINKALEISDNLDLLPQKARCLQTRGKFFTKHADFNQAIENNNEAVQIWEKLHDTKHLGGVYNNLGATYVDKGDYNNALKYLIKSLKIYDQNNDSLVKSKVLLNIGLVFYYQQNYNKALEYYYQSLAIKKNLKDKKPLSLVYNNIGIIYYYQKKHSESINAFKKSLAICENLGYKRGMSMPLFNIAEIYFNQDKYDSALMYYQKSYSIDTSLKDRSNIVKSLNKQAEIYRVFEKKQLAIDVAMQALDLAKEIDSKEGIKDSYETLSNIYSDMKDYKNAFHFSEMLNQIKDTLFSKQSSEAMAELQTKYETEKKDLQLAKQKETIKNQKLVFKILLIGIILSVFFITLILIEYFQKKRAYKEISIQKENITDSINYASRIQTALLPPEDLLNNLLPNHFILYMPRDIVSGDFYWITFSCDRTIIAVADCTGHGVPGAFMSMLGFAFLNEIVNKNPEIKANEILDELTKKVKSSLHQKDLTSNKDGMDIALAILDSKTNQLQFSGANNPLIICRNNEIINLQPDKMPIGFYAMDRSSLFTTQEITLEPNDTVYMFSDGYMDQFGGTKMKKLGKERFEKLLLESSKMNIKSQQFFLQEKIFDWMANEDQIDDILVLGIKV